MNLMLAARNARPEPQAVLLEVSAAELAPAFPNAVIVDPYTLSGWQVRNRLEKTVVVDAFVVTSDIELTFLLTTTVLPHGGCGADDQRFLSFHAGLAEAVDVEPRAIVGGHCVGGIGDDAFVSLAGHERHLDGHGFAG